MIRAGAFVCCWGLLSAPAAAWAQDEPGGPRIPAPPPERTPPPELPPPIRPPEPTPGGPAPGAPRIAPPPAEPETPEDEVVPERHFRALLGASLHYPFGNHGGFLDTREVDDASGLMLSLGWMPNDKILIGVRGDVLFGSMNRLGWQERLNAAILSSNGFEVGPIVQLRFRLPATFLLYLGADGAYATMASSIAASFGVQLDELTLAPGEQFDVAYRGFAVGGTLGLAWRGISSELRYVRNEWGTITVGGTDLDRHLSTDRIVLTLGFALRI